MKKAFRQGVLAGILAPLFFLAAMVYWVYRYTQRIPVPVRHKEFDEIGLRLVEPDEVQSYWAPWRTEVEPLVERVKATFEALRAYDQG